ncbi:TrmH family RNA methyltransferase [Candidatus Uhrbacteria bacterium]|nr:TrmH family RNA methyltransferase [Candidatus Uhrbacteria bacterium]
MLAILSNIRSVHNVGSIFRTADALGIEKLYLCGITPTPLDRFGAVRPQLAKVALGAERTVAWEKVRATVPLIRNLQHEGYTVLSLEQAKRAVSLPDLPRSHRERKLALVVGSEVRGLPRSVLKASDGIIEIPMRGVKESLNVAVAFGIAAFWLTSL